MLPLMDYTKMAPENVDEKDVFVCESRYNSRNRFFKKIKVNIPCCILELTHNFPILPFNVYNFAFFNDRIMSEK